MVPLFRKKRKKKVVERGESETIKSLVEALIRQIPDNMVPKILEEGH